MRPKTQDEIRAIRTSGSMLAHVLNLIESTLEEGISGEDIDQMARRELKKLGGKPAFLGVSGGRGVPDFPATICISVDDAVVHGLPTLEPFKNGQVIGFDFGVNFGGMITDAARTFIVGASPRSAREAELVAVTSESLEHGINSVKAGVRTGDIAAKIQAVLDNHKLGIVRELVGHGVGHDLHEPPEVPNYGFAGTGEILKTGMTIAIEPMATLGDWKIVLDPDKWTIRTRDGSIAAHFEDTILILDDGCEILTR